MNLKLLFLCLAAAGSCYAIEHEFGEGCIHIEGKCYKRCAKGTHEYMSACNPSIPTWSEPTCENPVVEELGTICDMSVCYCDPPTIRDTINKKCVLPEDCPAPGSKPTGPPVDDSYLLVDQGPIRPEPIQNKENEVSSNDDLNHVVVEKPQPEVEFGIGCLYVNGLCHKRCPKGTYAYTSPCSPSTPTWSESTCENPVVKDIGPVCGISRCECQSPTLRDTINNKCVLAHECPPPGSEPTGPPIDDSYLYVEQPGEPRPEPIQSTGNGAPSNDDLDQMVVEKPQPKYEFGEGCIYIRGKCYKRCAKGTHAYMSSCSTSHPTWSQITCENPVVREMQGAICGLSRCDCDSPTIRDTINNKCVLIEDCPAPGSKPTGPPVDDSYLLVDQGPTPPHPDKPEVSPQSPETEYGVGCLYILGSCHKRCAKGTHAYVSPCNPSIPTWSEITCEEPVARDIGNYCDLSRCDCDPPTVRDTINNKCVLPEDCPAPGSQPTGPPVDDSYLLVDQGPTPPHPSIKYDK